MTIITTMTTMTIEMPIDCNAKEEERGGEVTGASGGCMQPVLGEAKPTAQSARAHHQLMSLLLHDDDVTHPPTGHLEGDKLGKFLEIPTPDASLELDVTPRLYL